MKKPIIGKNWFKKNLFQKNESPLPENALPELWESAQTSYRSTRRWLQWWRVRPQEQQTPHHAMWCFLTCWEVQRVELLWWSWWSVQNMSHLRGCRSVHKRLRKREGLDEHIQNNAFQDWCTHAKEKIIFEISFCQNPKIPCTQKT